jgi:RES domain-containing protein
VALPELVARIDGHPVTPYAGRAYRHQAPQYDPLSGRGARMLGGRWNPRNSFAVLYLGIDRATVIDEFRRHAARQGRSPADFLPRAFYVYEVELSELLDLRDRGRRESLDLDDEALRADDLTTCQRIGEAAHHAGREGIIAPSAAGAGTVVAVFLDNLKPGSYVQPGEHRLWSLADEPPDL